MLPTLELGSWQVGTYQVTATLAVLIGGMWIFHRLLGLGYPPGTVMRGFMLTTLGAFAATYLITYLINRVRIARSGLLVQPEGRSIIWAIASTIAVAAVYCWREPKALGRALDMAAVPAALGLSIGRLGCLGAGCCYGRLSDSWLAMYLPDERGVWMARYPTQLMASAANLLMFVVLLAIERYGKGRKGQRHGWPCDGFLALLFVALFSLKRLGMGFLRQSGASPMVGPLSWMHVNALVGLVVATALMVNLLNKQEETTP